MLQLETMTVWTLSSSQCWDSMACRILQLQCLKICVLYNHHGYYICLVIVAIGYSCTSWLVLVLSKWKKINLPPKLGHLSLLNPETNHFSISQHLLRSLGLVFQFFFSLGRRWLCIHSGVVTSEYHNTSWPWLWTMLGTTLVFSWLREEMIITFQFYVSMGRGHVSVRIPFNS